MYKGEEDTSMTFLWMILCCSSQSTLIPSFTQEGYHNNFQLQGYHHLLSKWFHIDDLFCDIEDHIHFIHIHS